jgi:hypothetical protein
MAHHRRRITFTAILLVIVAWLVGCSKTPTTAPPKPQDPQTELTYAPLEGDTASYRIHFYWNGYDNDGEVTRFRIALDGDTALAPNQWHSTVAKDTTLLFLVDPVKEVKGHVFWVAAEDNNGNIDKTPAKRFFSAKTIPPISHITRGPNSSGEIIGPNFTFEWEGVDPDGSETGGQAPCDSFEYLLLQDGGQLDPDHPVLRFPPNRSSLDSMIINATGPSLNAPYDDWKWIGIKGKRKRFRNVTPGHYIFAERAVDIAGATEKLTYAGQPGILGISWAFPTLQASDPRNIRDFNVTNKNPGPSLTVCSSVLVQCLPSTSGSEDIPRKEIQIFEGETISFSWSADASAYGGEIVGYTSALDDTSTADWGTIDLLKTSVTLANLTVGPHFLFVRAVDDGGLVTNMKIPLRIVHPAFKDPPVGKPLVLYVDDFAAPPGTWQAATTGGGTVDYPKDWAPWYGDATRPEGSQEDQWWEQKILLPLSQEFGVDIQLDDRHDTVYRGQISGTSERYVFTPLELSPYRTIIWYSDFASPTALWLTLVGGTYSELAGYLRAGGTLILTGFQITAQSSSPTTTPSANYSRGLCALDQGTDAYHLSYFSRNFLGVDGALGSDDASRDAGGKDFVEGRVTPEGMALGFTTAQVDTGAPPAKWYSLAFPGATQSPLTSLAPGLPKVEGWRMQQNFACVPPGGAVVIRAENRSRPVALPVLTYHGVPTGIAMRSAPSPREGLVVGIATQAHDLGVRDPGTSVNAPITPQASKGVIGRMVVFGFPLYYLKDDQAYAIMRAAFAWVNASPTLPSYAP